MRDLNMYISDTWRDVNVDEQAMNPHTNACLLSDCSYVQAALGLTATCDYNKQDTLDTKNVLAAVGIEYPSLPFQSPILSLYTVHVMLVYMVMVAFHVDRMRLICK